jgi:predicted ATPase
MPAVRLQSVQYFERRTRPKEWTLDGLRLGPINLIVGRNATGKTRTLNLLWNLAQMFVPERKYRTANAGYDLLFDHDGAPVRYLVNIEDGRVTHEELNSAGEVQLLRGAGGEGEIFAREERRKIRFRPPENELAAVARRDSLQHPFLEPLHEWAHGVRYYTFGTQLGKQQVALPLQTGPDADDRDAEQVVGIFQKGLRDFGEAFVTAIVQDMKQMGYALEGIGVFAPDNILVLRGGVPSAVLALGAWERGVNGVVAQAEMSQGMFRALSILIQVNYSQMARRAHCILIDDIGEGLDYERSTRLIEILRHKAQAGLFQLVMTTNDQFVMNRVPLEEWSVLQRQGNHVRVRNYENSRKAFEDFKFIGLSNFSFFELDFAGPAEGAAAGGGES